MRPSLPVSGGALLLLLLVVGPGCGRDEVDDSPLLLDGRVTDLEGRPVEGATVYQLLRSRGDTQFYEAAASDVRTTTDETGWYRLPRVEHGAWLAVEAQGRCRAAVTLYRTGSRHDVVLFSPDGRVAGTVHDPRGKPIAGARVHCSTGSHELTWWTDTTTGDDGAFALDVPPGGPGLTAGAEGFWEDRRSIRPHLAGETVQQDLVLEPNPPVVGVVVDAESGADIPGAEVEFVSHPGAHAVTDARGRFSVSRRHRHDWSVHVSANGYASGWADPAQSDDGTLRVEVVLHRLPAAGLPVSTREGQAAGTSTVRGVVVDEEGRPIPAALVRARPLPSEPWPPTLPRVTDAVGSFRLEGVAPGPVVVEAWRSGAVVYGEAGTRVEPGGDPPPLRIVVPEGRVLRGSVVGGGGGARGPISGAIVLARTGDAPGCAEAVTDAEGRFTLHGLPEAEVLVCIQHRDHGPGYAYRQLFGGMGTCPRPFQLDPRPVLQERREPDGLRLRFVGAVPPDGTWLSAQARYPAGGGRGGDLTVWGGEGRLWHAQAAEWTFLAPGFYGGPVQLPGSADADDEPLDVALSAGGEIGGVVRDRDGAPVAGARLTLLHDVLSTSTREGRAVHTDAHGRFHFSGVEPGGPYELSISGIGFLGARVNASPGDAEVLVELTRDACVAGRVMPAPGATLPRNLGLGLREEGGGWRPINDLDASPTTFLGWVASAGLHELAVRTSDGLEGPATPFVVTEGGFVGDLVVVAPGPGLSIEGRVARSDGRPVSCVLVSVGSEEDERQAPREVRTDADGSFLVQGLQAGAYDVAVEAPVVEPTVTCDLASLQAETVRLRGVQAGTRDVELTVPRLVRVVGRVRPRPGAQLENFLVTVSRPGEPEGKPVAEGSGDYTDGLFAIGGLAPGTWRLRATEWSMGEAGERPVGWTDLTIAADGPSTVRDVEIELQRPGRAVANVREADGSLATEATVRLESAFWGSERECPVPSWGQPFRFNELPPVEWTLRARRSPDAPWSAPVVVTLRPGKEEQVELVLPER